MPTIAKAPLSQTVRVGRSGIFDVTVTGTGPLTFRCFKNGVLIPGTTGNDIGVLADANDVDGSYQITVEISNALGSVISAPAVMAIVGASPMAGGALVVAADGGTASATAPLGTTESVQVGLVTYEFQVSTFGSSGVLGKTLKYRARVTSFDPDTGHGGPTKSPKILLRPRLESACTAVPANGFPAPTSASCNDGTPKEIALAVTGKAWSQLEDLPVGFDWSQAPGGTFNMAFFNIDLGAFDARIDGTDASFKRPGG